MPASDDVVVFGVASSGVVEQWDGHPTPRGILLRWFARQDLGHPDLGWDVYRASVPDIPPLPFDDLNAPLQEGSRSWTYADRITLASGTGLHFTPTAQPGWWRLVVTPATPVTVRFSSEAWLVSVRADAGTSDLVVRGLVGGVPVREETLAYPGHSLTWRTRGIESLTLEGTGSVSFIGFHLLDDPLAWQQLVHRCLPVIDPAYPCGPQPGTTEADEARSRLPAPVAAEWAARFDAPFATLLDALRRLATHAAPAPIPDDPAFPDVSLAGDETAIIALSSLDPHGARILGLAYDDALGGPLDGREYAYKVTGRWLGDAVRLDQGQLRNPRRLLREFGLRLELQGGGRRGGGIVLRFDEPVHDFALELRSRAPIQWEAIVASGAPLQAGTTTPHDTLAFADLLELRLAPGPVAPSKLIAGVRWRPVARRTGLLPGIVAAEPGPPAGPATLFATVVPAASPSAIATADLDWPVTIAADNSIPEGAPFAYQIGHRRLAANPNAAVPTPGAIARKDLLYGGAPVLVAGERLRPPFGQRVLHSDRNDGAGLAAGRWGWWVRGIDLFGRVSAPSTWALAAVYDTAPPPAPIMVQAEWVQRDLPASTVAVLGRSTEATRWLGASAADEGLIAAWAYGPDEADVRDDVDGFELLVRRAQATTGAATGDALVYPDPWPAAVARFGPMAIRSTGAVTAAPTANPVIAVTVSAVQELPPAPNAADDAPVRWACVTDLSLDGAAGVFVGGSLVFGTTSFDVVASGDGPSLTVVVQHGAGTAPAAGAATLGAPAGALVSISTNLPALVPPAGLRARSGVLVVGAAASRLQVLRVAAGTFLCRAQGAVAGGDAATWFPVWSAAMDDAGFGPQASATVPVANAQVAVRAIRDVAGLALASATSAPLTVTAVDLTPPVTPTLTAIAFDPSAPCAKLATRADWYGRSYFTLSWTAQADRRFVVYRALGDEIARLDLLEYEKGGRRAPGFPQSADYPAGVEADATRRARVLAELAAIDAARATAGAADRAAALEAAYEALTTDTQMLLARQDYAWPAFAQVHTEPIAAAAYEDTLDGRSHGHWFYRVTTRTAAGLESAPSEPTPPICCPDVVPPAVPLAHVALADDNAVKLRWLASPDRDLDHYDIYASREATAVAELATMAPVESWTPAPREGGVVLERAVSRAPGEWCFWIVAVDDSGNRSAPSGMLKGRALRPPPAPPVWVSAERTPAGAPDRVTLTWSHPSDARLTCLVERRPTAGGMWAAASPWLPRGAYQYADQPLDLDAAWDYRLRVQDHLGQVASTLPVTTLGPA